MKMSIEFKTFDGRKYESKDAALDYLDTYLESQVRHHSENLKNLDIESVRNYLLENLDDLALLKTINDDKKVREK